jgi:hypothetical protein
MKKRLVGALCATGLSLTCLTGVASADHTSAAQVSENASCLGAERAERNSAGGDREMGGFGPGQAAFVKTFAMTPDRNYGEFIRFFKAIC